MKTTNAKGKASTTATQAARPRVLVTGSSGCVGSTIVHELVAAGWDVTALDMPGAPPPEADPARVHALAADLTQEGVAERAVEGAQVVVHAAAIVDIHASWEVLAPVNYTATMRLYEAARAAGVRQFVFFGTGSMYAPGVGPLDEDSPVALANDYVKTKVRAEEWLRSQRGGPVVNIVRPALIFGPRGKVLAGALATVPHVFRLFTDHMVTLRGGPRSNWVHGDDVGRAAAFLVEHPQPHGAAFNVANDDPVGAFDVFATALRSGGVHLHAPSIPYPTAVVKALLPLLARDAVMGTVTKIATALYQVATRRAGIRSPLVPKLDKEALDFAVRDVIFDNARLKGLGFTYRYPTFEDGWADTQRWYEANGWVPAN